VVLYDSTDPLIIAAFRQQPKDISSIQALRNAIKETFGSLTQEELQFVNDRFMLARTIPEVQATLLEEMVRNIDMIAELVAERTDHDPSELTVRNIAGAIIGVGLAAMLEAQKKPLDRDSLGIFDKALENLENGLERL
jgi:hypothetical protein